MTSVNNTAIVAIGAAWKARTGHYEPPLTTLTDQTQLTIQANGDGTTKKFEVVHSLAKVPTAVVLTGSDTVSKKSSVITRDATKVYVTFKVAPVAGTNNVNFTGMAAY